jgi:hypothetical protein
MENLVLGFLDAFAESKRLARIIRELQVSHKPSQSSGYNAVGP